MTHSFSVDEIQKMRVKLKTSTSFPNEMRQQTQSHPQPHPTSIPQQQQNQQHHQDHHLQLPLHHHLHHHEEGDNSSSGVSSDQEMTSSHTQIHVPAPVKSQPQYQPYSSTHIIHSHPKPQLDLNNKATPATTPKPMPTQTPAGGFGTLRKKNHHHHIRTIDMDREAAAMATSDHEEDDHREATPDVDSPSPPSKGFQRHNSLTRKQAASIAMNRAMQTRASAVSLVKLPPPIESDHDEPDTVVPMMAMRSSPHNLRRPAAGTALQAPAEQIVLAPPPQFCDCIHATTGPAALQPQPQVMMAASSNHKPMMGSVIANGGGTIRGVRIVGALPKVNTNVNVMNEMISSGDTS